MSRGFMMEAALLRHHRGGNTVLQLNSTGIWYLPKVLLKGILWFFMVFDYDFVNTSFLEVFKSNFGDLGKFRKENTPRTTKSGYTGNYPLSLKHSWKSLKFNIDFWFHDILISEFSESRILKPKLDKNEINVNFENFQSFSNLIYSNDVRKMHLIKKL